MSNVSDVEDGLGRLDLSRGHSAPPLTGVVPNEEEIEDEFRDSVIDEEDSDSDDSEEEAAAEPATKAQDDVSAQATKDSGGQDAETSAAKEAEQKAVVEAATAFLKTLYDKQDAAVVACHQLLSTANGDKLADASFVAAVIQQLAHVCEGTLKLKDAVANQPKAVWTDENVQQWRYAIAFVAKLFQTYHTEVARSLWASKSPNATDPSVSTAAGVVLEHLEALTSLTARKIQRKLFPNVPRNRRGFALPAEYVRVREETSQLVSGARKAVDDYKSLSAVYKAAQLTPVEVPASLSAAFSQDLSAVYTSNLCTPEGLEARQRLIRSLQYSLTETFKGDEACYLDVFGSCMNGLATRKSDIDLGITNPPLRFYNIKESHVATDRQKLIESLPPATQREGAQSVLRAFSKTLRRHRWLTINVILNARVPIIKLHDTRSNLECDIALSQRSSKHKSSLILHYVQCDHRVAPLIWAVKTWSKSRGIGDASTGSLNSFGYSLLTLVYLQNVSPPVIPCLQAQDPLPDEKKSAEPTEADYKRFAQGTFEQRTQELPVESFKNFGAANTMSLCELFCGFMKFYSSDVDWDTHCVSVRHGRVVPKRKQAKNFGFRDGHHTLMCIEDPFDVTDNVARNIARAMQKKIIDEMADAVQSILRDNQMYSDLLSKPKSVNPRERRPRRDRNRRPKPAAAPAAQRDDAAPTAQQADNDGSSTSSRQRGRGGRRGRGQAGHDGGGPRPARGGAAPDSGVGRGRGRVRRGRRGRGGGGGPQGGFGDA